MDILSIIIVLVVLLFSAILHEVAHGLVAERLGDPTARLMGRITLNPRKHIDPFFSILLPLVLFFSGSLVIGGAKPVPVDPFNLKEGKKDLALVSLAGPVVNILIAILASFLFKLTNGQSPIIFAFLSGFFLLVMKLNLLLAIFNLIPIPPLDGSKVFALLLPDNIAQTYLSIGNMGIFLFYILLLFPGLGLLAFMQNLLTIAEKLLGI